MWGIGLQGVGHLLESILDIIELGIVDVIKGEAELMCLVSCG